MLQTCCVCTWTEREQELKRKGGKRAGSELFPALCRVFNVSMIFRATLQNELLQKYYISFYLWASETKRMQIIFSTHNLINGQAEKKMPFSFSEVNYNGLKALREHWGVVKVSLGSAVFLDEKLKHLAWENWLKDCTATPSCVLILCCFQQANLI